MHKTFIIGDIHGCFQPLEKLILQIPKSTHTLVFLGDYIDRGPDSQKVVSRILELKMLFPHVVTLMGNHELMLLEHLQAPQNSAFLSYGGIQTLQSYGCLPADRMPTDSIPHEHLLFFNNLALHYEDEHAIYVHAGLQPGLHLSLQSSKWCLWARENFLTSRYDYGKKVIFGHTVFRAPYIEKNKIGIDTGAVYGGNLTGILLPDQEFFSVPGEKHATHETYTNK